MERIGYWDAKRLVLARIDQVIASLPPAERNMPRVVVMGGAYSWTALRREVEMDTPVGRSYVLQHARYLGYEVV